MLTACWTPKWRLLQVVAVLYGMFKTWYQQLP